MHGLLFRGVFLVAFATLLLEVALIRVLSFTIWYHFAYVVIATSLLGYGASGSLVSVYPRIGARDLSATLGRCSLLAAATSAGVLALISLLPFDPMEVTRSPTQGLLFLGYQVAVILPFFFSGLAISLALRAVPERVDRLYFWDLCGAGLGCAMAIFLMNAISPPGAVLIASAGFASAAVLFRPDRRLVSLGLTAALIVGAISGARIPFTPAASKHLIPQFRFWEPTFTRWTALFRTDLLEDRGAGPRIGQESEWGLSPTFPDRVRMPSRVINHDASASTWAYDLRSRPTLDFLDHHIISLPYLVTAPNPHVLVIGVGGGRDVIAAIQYEASHVTGVELDPVTIDLIRDHLGDVSNGFFRDPKISLVAGEGRHFAKTANDRFDLIQLTGVDTLSAEFSGAYVLAENYLYTVEAFHDFFDRLTPGGVLSFATGNLSPDQPRAAARIVSVAQQALRERGVNRPENHIAVIDSRKVYVAILIRTAPFPKTRCSDSKTAPGSSDSSPWRSPGGEDTPCSMRLLRLREAHVRSCWRNFPSKSMLRRTIDRFSFASTAGVRCSTRGRSGRRRPRPSVSSCWCSFSSP